MASRNEAERIESLQFGYGCLARLADLRELLIHAAFLAASQNRNPKVGNTLADKASVRIF